MFGLCIYSLLAHAGNFQHDVDLVLETRRWTIQALSMRRYLKAVV